MAHVDLSAAGEAGSDRRFIAAYEPHGAPRGYCGIAAPDSLIWPYSIAPGLASAVAVKLGREAVPQDRPRARPGSPQPE